jgi:hypothetical protein
MKKIILALALSLAAVCAAAQDLSVLSKAARMAYDYLSREGYRPEIDEDNDVAFKVQGYTFYVDNDPKDPTLLRIYAPYIYEVDLEDENDIDNALLACNDFTRNKKLVRAAINSGGGVTLYADTYIAAGDGDMTEFLECAVDFMVRGIPAWAELYKQFASE